MVQTVTMSIAGMVVSSVMTSAMTSTTSNAMTSAIIIGAVVVTVLVDGTTQIANKINSRALPYLCRIANKVVAMLKRVVVAAATMTQAMLTCALKNANRRWQQAPQPQNDWTHPSPCSKLKMLSRH